jgi:hypothetical protein
MNVLDELYLHLDHEDEPWTVHVEIRVDGPIELTRLEAAVRVSAGRHPLARAQLAPSRGIELHYAWLIADQLGDIDLREVSCRDSGELDRARETRLQDLLPLTGNVLVDTAVLSNLGRIDSVPHLGDAGPVRELWFSPPGRMPLGASFGAATLDGRLLITLRYRHPLLDATAADQFLTTFRETLVPPPSA